MGQSDDHRASALDKAVDFLRAELKDGRKLVAEVEAKGAAQGIAKRTLDRAREKIGVTSKKGRKGWMLSLPDEK